jgi:hypothetical protein
MFHFFSLMYVFSFSCVSCFFTPFLCLLFLSLLVFFCSQWCVSLQEEVETWCRASHWRKNPKRSLSGFVCITSDGRMRRVDIGVGGLLCISSICSTFELGPQQSHSECSQLTTPQDKFKDDLFYSSTFLFAVLYLHHPPRPRAARSHFAARVRSYKLLLLKNRSLSMCWESADHLFPQLAAYLALVINISPHPPFCSSSTRQTLCI